MDPYIEASALRTNVQEPENTGTDSWEAIADGVSRLFDRECEVPDGFFLPAGDTATLQNFRSNGTIYVQLQPYLAGSIEALTVDGTNRLNDNTYYESDNYLVFDKDNTPDSGLIVAVTAIWGFSSIAADISHACLEQALFMHRRKDLAFTELSGVSSSVITAEFSPSFQAVTKRYRGLYGQNQYFG